MRLLAVESDKVALRKIRESLPENVNMVEADTGEEGLSLGRRYDFDLITTEMSLPDMLGGKFIKTLRICKVSVPVLVLSSVQMPQTKIHALSVGADDYLTKPFHSGELVARMRALVRRHWGHLSSVIQIGGLELFLEEQKVTLDGAVVELTGKEYLMLELLMLRKGRVLTNQNFLDHLYGGIDEPDQKIVDVFICKLRKKLASSSGGYIETVWGRGYKLVDPTKHAQEPVQSAA